MTIGPVNGHGGFVHHGAPGNAGKGEPGEPDGLRGNHGDKGDKGDHGNSHKTPGTGNGNGNDNNGVQQRGDPRTGGNNPASPEGSRGNDGPTSNQGNYGGPRDSGSMTTGGPGLPGLLSVVPNTVHQLGNSLFSMANSAQSVLRDAEGRPEHRHVPGPPAHSNASASTNAGNAAPSANAQAGANAHAERSAYAGANGVPMSSGLNAPNAAARALGAFAGQGSATAGATPGAAMTAAAATSVASANAATMAQASTATPQPRVAADAALLAPNRPADAALVAGRTATTAPATAPPPTAAVPPTLPSAPAPPPGTTTALTAAGLTMATAAVNPPADARNVILPANSALAAQHGENLLNNPAGHTLDGAQRRSLSGRLRSMPRNGLARMLWAMGGLGADTDAAGSEREIARAMQWLFWMLAIIAYGCLAAAIVIFMGSDGRLMDSVGDRNSTAWLAMCGLAVGVVAWGVARRTSRRR
ncbi:MAG: hypothetical protein L0H23_08450 [Luteimonas sp.]|nr:hypothetical protein [Luteimonas sp.]